MDTPSEVCNTADFIFELVPNAKVSRLESRIESVVLMSEELICTVASFIDVENVEVPVVIFDTLIPEKSVDIFEVCVKMIVSNQVDIL